MERLSALMLTLLVSVQTFAAEPKDAAKPEKQGLQIATFHVDASTPIGSPLAYDPAIGVQMPLSCRGVVILSDQQPVVLCAVDWIGISNGGQTVFKEALAAAARTDPSRVAVHTLHQHDAPRCDFDADDLVRAVGIENAGFDARHARSVIMDASNAIIKALQSPQPVTHIGLGSGTVEKVASNRRILGKDGKVQYTRYTATRDPKIRAFPAGTIDPVLKSISFWNQEEPLAVLTYYATHPQSYYRTGLANPDFPGMARDSREQQLNIPHIHFNGAGGNIGAGKWNDGSQENRQVLADRVAAGMKKAWNSTRKIAVEVDSLSWTTVPVLLPVSEHLNEAQLLTTLKDPQAKSSDRWFAAKNLTWLRRCEAEDPILISCLKIGEARILHMPGELFVEYQLAAQKITPASFVATAAYGDYAPGYIGTKVAYSEGGYETSPGASKVRPEVEAVLMNAMNTLLTAHE